MIPDVDGLSAYKSAMAYSEGNLYVLPVDPTDAKNPGSIVGKGWPSKSTRDADVIDARWNVDSPPSIAIHTGRSGVVAFDFDEDGPIPDELSWLKSGQYQLSRPGASGNERGIYLFASTETFVSGKLTLTDGTQVGEIRSGNSVFIAAPSVHAKAATGAEYVWKTHGPVPELPEVARRYLRQLGCDGIARDGGVVADSAAVTQLKADTSAAGKRPHALDNLTRDLARKDTGTRDCLRNYLRIAATEARAGFYPFERATAELEAAARASYNLRARDGEVGADFDSHIGAREFARLVANAVGGVLSRSEGDILAEANRKYGSDSRADGGLSGDAKRNTPLDLRRLRREPPQPIAWLVPDLLARDSYVSLSAAPGTGKSVLSRAIAVAASVGVSALDPGHRLEPARVIYLDAENGEDWWRDGLDSMAAPMDLPNLSVVCYPDLGGLDTEKGAREFQSLIGDLAAGMDGEVDLVVLDTVSRFISGGENDADTWSQFYRLAIQPLRDQKVAVLRLDHLGKDADKGPRGSSHKLSDVDADFRMTAARAGSDDLTLTLGKRRRQHFAQSITLRRRDEPLRHELQPGAGSFVVRNADGTTTVMDPDTRSLVDDLDRLGVDASIGRSKAHSAYVRAGGTKAFGTTAWAAAVRFRKERAVRAKSDETEKDLDSDGNADNDS